MIIKLWYQQIVSGKKVYAQVPTKLKDKVAQMLNNNGYSYLVEQ